MRYDLHTINSPIISIRLAYFFKEMYRAVQPSSQSSFIIFPSPPERSLVPCGNHSPCHLGPVYLLMFLPFQHSPGSYMESFINCTKTYFGDLCWYVELQFISPAASYSVYEYIWVDSCFWRRLLECFLSAALYISSVWVRPKAQAQLTGFSAVHSVSLGAVSVCVFALGPC